MSGPISLPLTLPTGTLPGFFTPGPVQVWVGTGTVTSGVAVMQLLGVTRGGARIVEQTFNEELKSDVSGGERGPPADYQFLGELHMIECELAQYNESVLAVLETRVLAGSTRTKGMILGASSNALRVVLVAVDFARNYTRSFLVEPIERAPVGMAVMYPRVNFTCLEDASHVSGTNGCLVNGSPWDQNITISGSSLS